MNWTVRIDKRFPIDLQAAIIWYENISVPLADKFCLRVQQGMESVASFPESYPLVYQQGRVAMLTPFPWMILFLANNDVVSIVRLVHTASDWEF